MKIYAPLLLTLLLLAGCGDSASDTKTVTKMDAVEVQPGTISDSMIILSDSSVDGTAVDNNIPADPDAKSEEKAEDAEDAAADSKASGSDGAEKAGETAKPAEPAEN